MKYLWHLYNKRCHLQFGDNMPIYTIMNKDSDEIFEVNMKFTELETYLTNNPSHIQVFNKFPGIGDPARLGKLKPDNGFRDVLKEVKNHHKKDSINTW